MIYHAQSRDEAARKRFKADTKDHVMVVLRDDGLYRHIRFQTPGTSAYFYDLVTWPGVLAIVGDVQDLMFSRIEDMFEFFTAGAEGINPQYWAEKLQGPDASRAVEQFSRDMYTDHVREWCAEQIGDIDEGDSPILLRDAVGQELLSPLPTNRYEAIERLKEFSHGNHRIYEPYEWGLTEYSPHYLWCCWAIVLGIKQYREHTAKPS